MKNYQCRKCGLVVQKETTPSAAGCQVASLHSWNSLGDVGPDTYHCKKCGTLIKSKGRPCAGGCPDGNNHNWLKI